MNIQQRKRCLNIITASTQPQNVAKQDNNYVISESDIFSILRKNQYVMMLPSSYYVESPDSGGASSPWGETIVFKYKARRPGQALNVKDTAISDSIEKQITSKFASIIHSITTEYQGNDIYYVTITQKP
jgi:hypothetical protein